MRLCSRNLSTTLVTRMFSEILGRPGRRQQMPRITRSMVTPAWDARYSASITEGSTSAFIFGMLRAAALARITLLAGDQRNQALAQAPGRKDELLPRVPFGIPGQQVEECARV